MSVLSFGELSISRHSLAEVVDVIDQQIHQPGFQEVVTLNTVMFGVALSSPKLMAQLRDSALITADGKGIIGAIRLLGLGSVPQVTGVGLLPVLFERPYSFVLYGATPAVMARLCGHIQTHYPNAQIKGASHGFLSVEEEAELIDQIGVLRPDIVLVAQGYPKQSLFIDQLRRRLSTGVGIGVGGAFDVLSGYQRRAPSWICAMGLEWLYRMIGQPRRFIQLLDMFRVFSWVLAQKWGRGAVR